jgi:hypothetical protein
VAIRSRGAFYTSTVFAQVFHAFVCKTRYVSMFTHGIFNNAMMNYAYVTATPNDPLAWVTH